MISQDVLMPLKRDHFRLLPVRSIETVEDMIKMGVYVNDLNLHDSSRELILAGTQQSAELQLALDQVSSTRTRPLRHQRVLRARARAVGGLTGSER